MAEHAATVSACHSPAFLREQINSILKFYAPVVRDPKLILPVQDGLPSPCRVRREREGDGGVARDYESREGDYESREGCRERPHVA